MRQTMITGNLSICPGRDSQIGCSTHPNPFNTRIWKNLYLIFIEDIENMMIANRMELGIRCESRGLIFEKQ